MSRKALKGIMVDFAIISRLAPYLPYPPDRALKAALPFDVLENLIAYFDRTFQAGGKGEHDVSTT